MNYKRRKPHIEKDPGSWRGSSVQAKLSRLLPVDRPYIKHPQKDPIYCKRLKGEHNFVELTRETSTLFEYIWSTHRCTGCGKKILHGETANTRPAW